MLKIVVVVCIYALFFRFPCGDQNGFFIYFMCCMSVTIGFHHRGSFVRDWLIYYKDGVESVIDIDVDKFCYFEAVVIVDELLKQFKYGKDYRLWWQVDEEVGFKLFRLDEVATEIKEHATRKRCKVTIYVEHDVVDKDVLVSVPRCVDADDMSKDKGNEKSGAEVMCKDKGNEKVVENEEEDVAYGTRVSSSEEDGVRGFTFDDSEDDRGLGLDENINWIILIGYELNEGILRGFFSRF